MMAEELSDADLARDREARARFIYRPTPDKRYADTAEDRECFAWLVILDAIADKRRHFYESNEH